ncbi:MAG: isoprenylcysteine carboxylmethyltransferase family protein [Candidatus Lokiarchaeota archaeon]|nr:isoprenylcysteine carboxylmethyltransferase family protein [Candidatus Lokiarchaeota archaeon]
MSILWLIRIILIFFLYSYILIYALLLKDRKKYSSILENTSLNIFLVVFYNTICYLTVLLPADLNVIAKPEFLKHLIVIIWFVIFAIFLFILGNALIIFTLRMRKVVGAQDTEGTLMTNHFYSFCRHPIYLGITLISLGFALIFVNFDAIIVISFIILGNYLTGTIEEKYDMRIRFGEEYKKYRDNVRRYGPLWFWVLLIIALILPIIIDIAI